MKFFNGDNDNRDFSNPQNYAFLNWCFDDGLGKNSNPNQHIYDNYILGKAFIGNAILTLTDVLEQKNTTAVADKLIFPILFNTWHGLELWLKSSIAAITLLISGNSKVKFGHKIVDLSEELISILRNNKYEYIISTSLNTFIEFINEIKRVNAHFDFVRYSFDSEKNYQFYNAPYKSDKQWQKSDELHIQDIVPNTCIELYSLFEGITKIFEEFGAFVEYLTLCISEDDDISDANYKNYLISVKNSKKIFEKHESKDKSIRDIIFTEL